jgi:hypothetical protein
VVILDLATSDPGLKEFRGGFIVGQYAFFVPNKNGIVGRVDLKDFTTSGVTSVNLAAIDSSLVDSDYSAGFSDGRYAYFVPDTNGSGLFGKVARVDLQNFTPGGVKVLDLAQMEAGLVGVGCGFTDGHFAYFMPLFGKTGVAGKEVRVDLQNFTLSGVTLLDLAKVDSRLLADGICFTDGHDGYSMPTDFPIVTRVDLSNFTLNGVTTLDLRGTMSNVDGSYGGFLDGHYAYFNLLQIVSGGPLPTGKVARVDLQNFTPGGVTILNFEKADPGLGYLMDGFTDGQYLYFESVVSGLVMRIKSASIPPA